MKNQKITVTIGIPAFNEEANIGYLLESLLQQQVDGFGLERILVISDGSTDQTVRVARKIKNKLIEVIDEQENKGQSYRQNQMLEQIDTDVLVLLNADILIADNKFISKLIKPIINRQVDLTSVRMRPLLGVTFLEKILVESIYLKNYLFEHYRNGDNIYTVHGAARGFSKRLYSKLRFPDQVGEDAYSYLFTKKNNLNYEYVSGASLMIKLPENLADHQKQSNRYHKSKYLYVNEFGWGQVIKAYWLPILSPICIFRGLVFTFKTPVLVFNYGVLHLLTTIRSLVAKSKGGAWERSMSTTVLIKH